MRGEVIDIDVFTLLDQEIVALEVDSQNIQDDSDETVTQSLMIVTKSE